MPHLASRFWSKVNKHGPLMKGMSTRCWEWTASVRRDGYGQLNVEGKTLAAHRLSWFLKHGKWPQPCALHKCDYRRCVRPSHLFEGTKDENLEDMVKKGRSAHGENRPDAKLPDKSATSIRRKYKTGDYTQRQLADEYNIDQSWVSRIIQRKARRHAPC